MKHSTDAERDRPDAWAVLLAGGDGTRLQSLTRKITGDLRPKQFCRIFGDRSLLGHTRKRLRPIFRDDRTLFVVTKGHETFYMEELSDANASASRGRNRRTGEPEWPSSWRYFESCSTTPMRSSPSFPPITTSPDEAAFAATVRSAIGAAREYTESVILIGAEPQWPEVELRVDRTGRAVCE